MNRGNASNGPKPRRGVYLLAPFLCAVLLLGCGPAPPPRSHRLVVVGVDGAGWNAMSPLLAQGRLPHLAAVYRAGSAGVLRSIEPFVSAALWTTLATGKPAGAHGIRGNAVRVAGEYILKPVTADMRRCPPIWTIASHENTSVGVTAWAATYPPDQVDGFVLSGGYDPEADRPRGGITPHGALPPDGERGAGLPLPARLEPVAALDPGLRSSFEQDLLALSRGLSLYRVYQPTLALFRFRSIDYAAHHFWQYFEPRYLSVQATRGVTVSVERARALGRAVPGAYELFDEWIDMLMKHLPERTTLIIVSDHGFRGVGTTDYLHIDLDRLLARLGLLTFDRGGRPDWSHTRVFTLPDAGGALHGLYLNVKGREPEGAVEAGDVEATIERTISTLTRLRTSVGQPLLRAVTRVDSPGPGEAEIEVIENPGIDPMGRLLINGEPVTVRTLYRRFSDDFGIHESEGILLAAGVGVAAGRRGWTATVYDIVPTILYLCRLPLTPDMPGAPIASLLRHDVPPDYPSVGSYNDLEAAPPPLRLPDEIASRWIQQLREISHLLEPVNTGAGG